MTNTTKTVKLSRLDKRILVTAREFGTFIVEEEGSMNQYARYSKTSRARQTKARAACQALVAEGLLAGSASDDQYELTDAGRTAATDLDRSYLPASLR